MPKQPDTAASNEDLFELVRENDNEQGFGIFFSLLHNTAPHPKAYEWIANAYEAHRQGKGLLQECHRESGKTTVFSKFFLAFRIGMEPHKTNTVIRINDDKANETTAAVANIIEHNPLWKGIFPHVVPDKARGWGANGYHVRNTNYDDDEWAQIKAQSPDGPTFVGYGWKSGSIIGSRFNGVVIVDDIHDRENSESERQLAAVKSFWKNVLDFCIMRGAWEIWNFTPWTYNDVYAEAKATGEYLHSMTPVMLPAEEGDEGATYWEQDDIPLSGRYWQLYWPEVWDFERIGQKYRKNGAIAFARMMLLDLEATKGVNLKAEWLHEYPSSEIRPSWPVIMGVDYASTADKLKDKERDYFALAILRAIPGGGLVLADGYRGHLSKGEALDLVMSYWGMYPTTVKIGVENIGKGEEFYNDLALVNDSIGRVPPLMPISHGRRSKGERFEQWLGPRFQMSRLWIADTPTPFLREFRDEWLLWPNAQHDDCLDGVYMAAAAAEGYMPTKAERTIGRTQRKRNPFVALGRA